MGVPRVYEKFEEAIKNIAATKGGFARSLGNWAKGIGYQASLRQAANESPPFCYSLANPVVLKSIKKAIGM
jgi:long-chain-fatty-acid--CoA ligase ACSBG